MGRGFRLSGTLSYAWGEEHVADGPDLPLTRVPPLFGHAALRWDSPESQSVRFFLELYLRGAAHQDRLSAEDESDSRIPEDGTPAWWTLNARMGLLTERMALTLALENLRDVRYRYHGSGFDASGVHALLTLEAFL